MNIPNSTGIIFHEFLNTSKPFFIRKLLEKTFIISLEIFLRKWICWIFLNLIVMWFFTYLFQRREQNDKVSFGFLSFLHNLSQKWNLRKGALIRILSNCVHDVGRHFKTYEDYGLGIVFLHKVGLKGF